MINTIFRVSSTSGSPTEEDVGQRMENEKAHQNSARLGQPNSIILMLARKTRA